MLEMNDVTLIEERSAYAVPDMSNPVRGSRAGVCDMRREREGICECRL